MTSTWVISNIGPRDDPRKLFTPPSSALTVVAEASDSSATITIRHRDLGMLGSPVISLALIGGLPVGKTNVNCEHRGAQITYKVSVRDGEMSLMVEAVVDGGMHVEKTLPISRRLEPLHPGHRAGRSSPERGRQAQPTEELRLGVSIA